MQTIDSILQQKSFTPKVKVYSAHGEMINQIIEYMGEELTPKVYGKYCSLARGKTPNQIRDIMRDCNNWTPKGKLRKGWTIQGARQSLFRKLLMKK